MKHCSTLPVCASASEAAHHPRISAAPATDSAFAKYVLHYWIDISKTS
jgi:hypothetical protein